jgi:hypothetical protein
MDIKEFCSLLDFRPVVVTENLPAVGLVPGVEVVTDMVAFQRQLDTGRLDPSRRYVLLHGNGRLRQRFPVVNPTYDPFRQDLSYALFDRFDTFRKLMVTQDQVHEQLLLHADKDVLVFIIVDGLSFKDCRARSGVQPCLVPGVTKTLEGYRRVVGQPTLGRRLERRGFLSLLGFTYWERDDDPMITDEIFVPFSETHMNKVREFRNIIEVLEGHPLRRTYVQVVLQGLDYLSHRASDEPMVEAHVGRLFDRIEAIADILRRRGRTAAICMTADHGILWRQEHQLEKITDAAWTVGDGARYLNGKLLRSYARNDNYAGRQYTLLKYPYIFRNLGPTEWGVHGGISYEESVVPFVLLEV